MKWKVEIAVSVITPKLVSKFSSSQFEIPEMRKWERLPCCGEPAGIGAVCDDTESVCAV